MQISFDGNSIIVSYLISIGALLSFIQSTSHSALKPLKDVLKNIRIYHINMMNEIRKPRISYNPCTQQAMCASEEIVISGIAGRFPESDNVRQLQENLFNKVDMITDDERRWKSGHPEIPQRTGKVNDVDKFDALFFGVNSKQADSMDPMVRMLMEHAYEAVIDAGINPRQLRGSNTGVFIGACFSESEKTLFYENLQANGLSIPGCSRAMYANRLSYWFGLTGPSYTIDTACSSSLYAMDNAYRAIRTGQCEAAIVGGANLCLHPAMSINFFRLGILSPDGRCKCFTENANGYSRSEAISVAFLQRSKDAKRIYATVVHSKTNNDGFKEEGLTFPSTVIQSRLLKEVYEECKVPLSSVSFFEAHGTGTRAGDLQELNAIASVFCVDRDEPLKIGSVKSNLGHTEAVSGMCAVDKIIIANETGILPPNLHYKHPREGVNALEEGQLQVITEPTPWKGGYAGISSFGFGGANAHIVVKSNSKDKLNNGAPRDDLPRLVAVSGRTEEAVDTILTDLENRAIDVEYIKLFHEIHTDDIPGHLYRAYTVLSNDLSLGKRMRAINEYPGTKRSIWFVFSGMGSQWPAMGSKLLRLPVFAKAIEKCDAVLRTRNVDIYNIISNPDKSTLDNIINSFVGIAAVQIGLVDLLQSLGIVPDYIIGHSVGELGCAYADGCLTAEQMVLAAYFRGFAITEANTIRGSMAAVGLGYTKIKDLCPSNIQVACHNGPESSTISGPAESIKDFVKQLQQKEIFVREIPCNNVAYHSRHIAAAGPKLQKYLEDIIPNPKPRSMKWVSTSVPENSWKTGKAQFASAEYFTNNLLSSVLFEEALTLVAKDAVTIEIAPHGLLQAILRRSLNSDVTNIALTQRDHKDNVEVFLQAIGKLYNVGLQPSLSHLYPEVELPVSRGTPMISPLIKWDHSASWFVASFEMQEKITSGSRVVELSPSDEGYEYMTGHIIDDKNLLPATGYLTLVWETIGMMQGKLYTEVSVVFKDVKFLRATILHNQNTLKLTVMIHKGSGRFEIVEGGEAIVTGHVHSTSNPSMEKMNLLITDDHEKQEMSSTDFYKELRVRGHYYQGLFKAVKSASFSGSEGTIIWSDNWVTFMDSMLQIILFAMDTRSLYVPTSIGKLVIDTQMHSNQIHTIPGDHKGISVYYDKTLDLVVAGGIEIQGCKMTEIFRKQSPIEPVLETYKFISHRDNAVIPLKEGVHLATHIALENHLSIKVKILEEFSKNETSTENLLSPLISEILNEVPIIQADVSIVTDKNTFKNGSLPEHINVVDMRTLSPDTNALLVAGYDLLSQAKRNSLTKLLHLVKDDGYIMTIESCKISDMNKSMEKINLNIILEKMVNNSKMLLLRKKNRLSKQFTVVKINNDAFSWIDELKSTMKADIEPSSNTRILVVGKDETGIVGFVNCLRKEPGWGMVRGFSIQDKSAPSFSLYDPLYADQINLDLAINVLRPNNTWGSYRHMPLLPPAPHSYTHAYATQLIRGDMSTLQWIAGPLQPGFTHPDLVRVVYSTLNFRDIMLASGKLETDMIVKTRAQKECYLGSEYCGVDLSGQRVMGIMPFQALTNQAVIDRNLSWYVPSDWTLEDGGTVPCAYATCYYALHFKGNIKRDDKVLIHAGSGGIGQAAITLALHEGCEVFTTVSTFEKRRFIRERFPTITDDHIGNSRNTSFEQLILKQTNGRGVDIVLNSLADENLQASIRCLATGGKFLEIGKFDIANNTQIGMGAFSKGISFHGILLDDIFDAPEAEKMKLKEIIQKGLDNGFVKPLTRKVFSKDQLETAFRYMAYAKHVGKVLIKISDDENRGNLSIKALPRYYCLPDRSYIIHGGLGGLGLELADWLVLRGARNLVLTSRSGFTNGYQRMRVSLWRSYGVRVVIVTGKNAADRKDCAEILKTAIDLAPIDAIFMIAVVLKDALFKNQTADQFKESFESKAWSTKTFDELSREICPELRHFVGFSSYCCGRGNAEQTNYGMANSIIERICENRVTEGFPGLAIQWAAIGDVGVLADMQDSNKDIVIGGTFQQKIASCLQKLNDFLTQKEVIVATMLVAEKKVGVSEHRSVRDTILTIMNVKDVKSVSHQTSLAELGMDSIMAVEIKQTLEREFGIFVTVHDIRTLKYDKLSEMDEQMISTKENNNAANVL